MKDIFDALYDALDELDFPYTSITDENGYYMVHLDPYERLPFSSVREAEQELQVALMDRIGRGVSVVIPTSKLIGIYLW